MANKKRSSLLDTYCRRSLKAKSKCKLTKWELYIRLASSTDNEELLNLCCTGISNAEKKRNTGTSKNNKILELERSFTGQEKGKFNITIVSV